MELGVTMKYDPLKKHLLEIPNDKNEDTLTFRQLEAMLGFELPKSAIDFRQWWGNQTDTKGRSQAAAWITAGFEVESVQLRSPGGWVRFRRK